MNKTQSTRGDMADGIRATDALISLVADMEFDTLPAKAVARAKMAILDLIGCALAGADTEPVHPLVKLACEEGGEGQAVIWGYDRRVPASMAALINGTSGHSLDFDDTSPPLIGHPSVPLVPALFAIADRNGADGRAFITAFVAGFEVETRLGRIMNPPHYSHGWHATSSLGTLGAAMAAGKLLGLDRERLAHALAIAASSSSGLRDNFGSDIKPIHAGFAARAGVVSALLAFYGSIGSAGILDGTRGFISVYAGRDAAAVPVADKLFAAHDELEIVNSGIGIKRYACCGCTHTALDALLSLCKDYSITADKVESIRCGVNALAPDVLIHHRPITALQGKFSMEYCLAVGLMDGTAGLPQFTDARVLQPAVQELLRRVEMYVDPDCPVRQGIFPSKVAVTLKDGCTLTRQVNEAQGHPDHPLDDADLERKFLDCAGLALTASPARSALDKLRALESVGDVRVISELLVGRNGE